MIKILWIEPCHTLENQILDKKLSAKFSQNYKRFKTYTEACDYLTSNQNEKKMILSNSKIRTELLETLKPLQNCFFSVINGKKWSFFDQNHQIIYTVESNLDEVINVIDKQCQQIASFVKLEKLFNQDTLNVQEYTHSYNTKNISFFIEMQRIKSFRTCQDELRQEYDQWVDQKHYKKLKQLLQQKKFKSLFLELIYIYSDEFIYESMNQSFALNEFNKFHHTLNCLYYGFIQNNKRFRKNLTLYRGLSFYAFSDYNAALKNLTQGCGTNEIFYWTTLTSTSLEFGQAEFFANQKQFGLIFVIELSDHPALELQKKWVKNQVEKEVLLFPQFPFKVKEITALVTNLTIIKIQQSKEEFSFSINENDMLVQWEKVFLIHIYPCIIEILEYFQWKLNLMIENFSHFSNDYLNLEINNFFTSINKFFLAIFSVKNNEIENSIKSLIEELKNFEKPKEGDFQKLKKHMVNVSKTFAVFFIKILITQKFNKNQVHKLFKEIDTRNCFNYLQQIIRNQFEFQLGINYFLELFFEEIIPKTTAISISKQYQDPVLNQLNKFLREYSLSKNEEILDIIYPKTKEFVNIEPTKWQELLKNKAALIITVTIGAIKTVNTIQSQTLNENEKQKEIIKIGVQTLIGLGFALQMPACIPIMLLSVSIQQLLQPLVDATIDSFLKFKIKIEFQDSTCFATDKSTELSPKMVITGIIHKMRSVIIYGSHEHSDSCLIVQNIENKKGEIVLEQGQNKLQHFYYKGPEMNQKVKYQAIGMTIEFPQAINFQIVHNLIDDFQKGKSKLVVAIAKYEDQL